MRARIILFVRAALLGAAVLPSSGAQVLDNGLTDCEPKIYWTHPSIGDVGARIQRSNLDGSKVETLVTGGLLAPWPLEIDFTAGKMYWGNVSHRTIQRANLDGSFVETVVEGVFRLIGAPAGLALV